MLQNHYNGKKEVITLNNYDYSWSQITHQKKILEDWIKK